MPSSLIEQIGQLDSLLNRIAPPRRQIINLKTLASAGKKTRRILELIRANPRVTNREIAESIGETETAQSYHALKSTIYSRLINGVFLLDFKSHGFSNFAVLFYKNQRSVSAAKILAFLGARTIANSIAIKGLGSAERLELVTNALEFLTILQNGAVLQSDRKKLKLYRRKASHWLNVLTAQMEITGVLHDVLILHTKRGSTHPVVRDRLFTASMEAERLYRQYPTFNLGQIYYRMRSLYYQCKEEYANCVEVCLEAERYIASRPDFSNPTRLAEFAIKRLSCAIQLRDREQGKQALEVCTKAYPEGTINWFVLMENRFLLSSMTLDLEDARAIYNTVTKAQGYLDLPEYRRERWLILQLYLLYGEGKLMQNARLASKTTPTFNDFIAWVPSYSADKVGYNASVLILHVLYLIERKEWLKVLERVNALQTYRLRHLKGKNRQADLFIQLLIKVEQLEFVRTRVEEQTESLYQSLLSSVDSNDAVSGVQILPFEWLWQRVLQSLK